LLSTHLILIYPEQCVGPHVRSTASQDRTPGVSGQTACDVVSDKIRMPPSYACFILSSVGCPLLSPHLSLPSASLVRFYFNFTGCRISTPHPNPLPCNSACHSVIYRMDFPSSIRASAPRFYRWQFYAASTLPLSLTNKEVL
jgi:hypothetical protein